MAGTCIDGSVILTWILKGAVCSDVDWIHLAQERGQ